MKAEKRKKKPKEKRTRLHATRVRMLRRYDERTPAFGSPVDCLLAAFLESYANEVFESLLQTPKGEGLFSVHIPDFPEIKARIRLDDMLKKQKGAGQSDGTLKFVFQEP